MGIADELGRYLDDSSRSSGRPRLVILIGGIGSGKTTLRMSKYATGFVVMDAGVIFGHLSEASFPGSANVERSLWIVGRLLARTALAERRNIVVEVVGDDYSRLKPLIDAMRGLGYSVDVEAVVCEPGEALLRAAARPVDAISAVDCEAYHLSWLHAEAIAGRKLTTQLPLQQSVLRPDETQQYTLNAVNAMNVAIEKMRAAGDEREIPGRMAANARAGFGELDRQGEVPIHACISAADLLYRRISELERVDQFTRAYVSIAVRECFRQLMLRECPVYYILDNELREDRFRVLVELFGLAGMSLCSPAISGPEWVSAEQVLAANLDLGLHAAYVERDASVNHLDKARELAGRFACTATFRNVAPTSGKFVLIGRSGRPGASIVAIDTALEGQDEEPEVTKRQDEVAWEEVQPLAKGIFRVWTYGSELRWAEQTWKHLAALGLTGYSTPLERAMVEIRLMALGSIYLDWCAVVHDERIDDDPREWFEMSNISDVQLGQLIGPSVDPDDGDDLEEALNLLISQERPGVVSALRKMQAGDSGLFVSLWWSSISDPTDGDDDDELAERWEVLNDPSDEKLAGYGWIDGGCEAIGPVRCRSDFD